MSFSLIATFTAKPGHRDEMARLIADFGDEVRREPGCLVFEPFTDSSSDHDFVAYETYKDAEAYAAHTRNPAGPGFAAAMLRCIVGDGSVLQFLSEVR
ncbi:MAG: putative quinol monooxygenase [Arachnia sp.]